MAARKPLVVVSGTLQELPATDTLLFNIPQVIEVTDNTKAALRITQLGTGNALLVEDSTNPDSTPFVIDGSGKVIIGHVTPLSGGGALQANNAGIATYTHTANAFYNAYFTTRKSRSAVPDVFTIVQQNDELGGWFAYGDDGTDLATAAASIVAYVDGVPGVNDMPGRLVFSTTADGASSPTERMRIDSAGNVSIGTQVAAAKLDIGATDNANEGAEVRLRGATNAVVDWNFDVYQSAFRLFTTDKGAGTNWQGRLSISHDTGIMVQMGSATFVGHAIRNNSASATVTGYSYVDFQNESGVATGSIINVHATDGSSRMDFSATPAGARNSDRRATVFQVYGNGNALAVSPNGGLGYGTGAGGTVTQATSKSTTVGLNTPCGKIIMNAAALAANTMVRFTLNNTRIAATDVVVVCKGAGGSVASYDIRVDWVQAGSCDITVANITGSSLSEAVVIHFAIIKGASS